MKRLIFRTRVYPVEGFWVRCSVMALVRPEPDGWYEVYLHPRRDLTLEQARALSAKILEAGEIETDHWQFLHKNHTNNLID